MSNEGKISFIHLTYKEALRIKGTIRPFRWSNEMFFIEREKTA